MTHVLASTLSTNSLANVLHDLVAERWDNMDLSPFMVYLVDNCAPALLPYLAEQFDVEAMGGMAVATNEAEQRDLLKVAITLHKYLGTPYALREASKSIGFEIITIVEGAAALDGIPNTIVYPEDKKWALFRVEHIADEFHAITAEQNRRLRLFVENYKPQRSLLTTLGYKIPTFNEELTTTDDYEFHVRAGLFDVLIDNDYDYEAIPDVVGSDAKYLIDDNGVAITDLLLLT